MSAYDLGRAAFYNSRAMGRAVLQHALDWDMSSPEFKDFWRGHDDAQALHFDVAAEMFSE